MKISAGTYRARATGNVVLGTSSQKGTPFIELYFTVTQGECAGSSARWTSYFSEKTSERTIEALGYCGWAGDDLSEFNDGTLHGLDANEVEIVVDLEEYVDKKTGEPRTSQRVSWVNKAGGSRYLNLEGAMAPEAAAAFGEKMRGLVLATKSKSPVAAPSASDVSFDHGANETPGVGTGPARKSF